MNDLRSTTKDSVTERLSNRLVLGLLLGGLLLLTYAVVQPFVVPVAWAIILAYTTWPLLARIRRLFGGRRTLAAAVMTALLTAAFVLPALWLALLLRSEMANAYAAVASLLSRGPYRLPDALAGLPLLGGWLQGLLDQFTGDPDAVRNQVAHWVETRADESLRIVGGLGRNAAKMGFALITVFFLYRDGERVLAQAQRVLRRFLGARVDAYLAAVGSMTMAVVWGLVATALGQGVVAGLGYWWFGLEAPVLLGAITAVIALLPFGTPFVWGSAGAWLIANGETFDGIGLLLWGTLVVSWVDNLVRPMVISNATRIPFLLVMFGVLGGLAAFGLVGLFVGPVILAVLMAVWREWIEESVGSVGPPPGD
ncbi:MAG: AI-2E family transporter [Burkholderiaceae bacterium]|jgi:predicted PurR-regulated permease PerM|nr:AI-2E family transporter [Burkholderiaceae bacterium]HMN65124.1 AI-2E family transporter [Burkholderiaceae bacterium]